MPPPLVIPSPSSVVALRGEEGMYPAAALLCPSSVIVLGAPDWRLRAAPSQVATASVQSRQLRVFELGSLSEEDRDTLLLRPRIDFSSILATVSSAHHGLQCCTDCSVLTVPGYTYCTVLYSTCLRCTSPIMTTRMGDYCYCKLRCTLRLARTMYVLECSTHVRPRR